MATYVENLQSAIDRARAEVIRHSAGSHTPRDLEKLIESVGADLELFLKTAVYEGSRRVGLKSCIRKLTEFGVEQADIDGLDRLREAYNTAKHEPGSSLSSAQADELLEDALAAVGSLQAVGAGRVNTPEPVQATRQFWLLVGDHLIGGETEIDICMPMPDVDFPPGLDIVNIEMAAWPQARQGLAEAGELHEGSGSIPDRVYQVWSNESDVALIGSWTGQYRDLLRTLLPFEKVSEELLPGLARGDDFTGTLSGMLMSAVDLGGAGSLPGSEVDICTALLVQAETSYSIPASKPAAVRASEEIARSLCRLTDHQRLELTGPLWRSRRDLDALKPAARAVGLGGDLVVASDGTLVVWTGN